VRIGQWLEQDAFNDAEDDGVGADADGQGEKRDGGEHGRAAESAECLPELTDDHCHLPDLLDSSSIAPSGEAGVCGVLWCSVIRGLGARGSIEDGALRIG